MRTAAMPHTLTLRRMTAGDTDDRNNPHRTLEATYNAVPARVDIAIETEAIEGRDSFTEELTAIIPPTWGGVSLNLDAHDQVIYAGSPFELIGKATPVTDHAGRLLHYELDARRIVG